MKILIKIIAALVGKKSERYFRHQICTQNKLKCYLNNEHGDFFFFNS